MKMKSSLLAMLAVGLLAACSDSSDLAQNDAAKGSAAWDADGNGYVTINVQTPAQQKAPSRPFGRPSRANGDNSGSWNDNFQDGTANEYAVYDAVVVLFSGTDESTAKFAGAYSIPGTFNEKNPANDQITATAKITRKIAQVTDNVYAYVILNGKNNSLLEVSANVADSYTNTADTGMKINGTEFNGTFAEFQKLTTDKIGTKVATGFVMGNAPLADQVGGQANVKITTLVDITGSIKATEQEAEDAAKEIYVERAVAKVTLEDGATGTKQLSAGTDANGNKLSYTIKAWTLDNTNTKTYVARNISVLDATTIGYANADVTDDNSKYRFVGTNAVATGAGYRTYWAQDVNYSDDQTTSALTSIKTEAVKDGEVSTAAAYKPLYCLENTFDVAHMKTAYTTRAIVKVQIGDDATDHYMYNNDATTYKAFGNNGATMTSDLTAIINTIPAVKAVMGTETTISDLTFDWIATTSTTDNGTVDASNAYKCEVKSFKIGNTEYNANNNSSIYKLVKDYFGSISIYREACAYYPILIKHFGDDLTPWNAANSKITIAPVAGNSYNNDAQNYLGRYGVLRNNWYQLNVTGVKQIGTPDIPEDSGTTDDDEIESYLSVKINILSWAVRKQDATLQ